jgi:hypothetical protein
MTPLIYTSLVETQDLPCAAFRCLPLPSADGRCSPSRGYCILSVFASFCTFSSQVEILVKRDCIWMARGAPVAIRRVPVHPLPYCFRVFPQTIKNYKTLEKPQLFEIPTDIGLLECLLGAPGCSFSGSLKFEKHTFPKKGPNLKKHGLSLYPMVLAQKSAPLVFAPPEFPEKVCKKSQKVTPKPTRKKT